MYLFYFIFISYSKHYMKIIYLYALLYYNISKGLTSSLFVTISSIILIINKIYEYMYVCMNIYCRKVHNCFYAKYL